MAKITGNLTGAHSISVELTPKKTLSGSISSGGGKVKSVNGMIGDVVLTANDIYNGAKSVAECLEEKAGILEDTVSGSIVSFTPDKTIENIKGVSVDINPVQDLHGYDNPWPAGGGKNKLPRMTADSTNGLTVTINSDDSITVTGTATGSGGYITKELTLPTALSSDTPWTFSTKNPVPSTLRLFTSPGTADIGAGNTSVTVSNRALSKLTLYLFTTAGTSYNFTIYPQLELGSTATAYSPYSNICPISGWDECRVMRAGKNLCGHTNEDLPKTSNGVTFSRSGDDYNVIATADKSGYPFAKFCELHGLKAGTYTMSIAPVVAGLRFRIINRSVSPVVTIATSDVTTGVATFTIAQDISDTLNLELAVTASSISVGTHTVRTQIELGSTATSYSPYQGNLYTISLGQTVYGGRLDVINGELVVDRARDTLASGVALVGSYGSGVRAYTLLNVLTNRSRTNVQRGEVLSNLFKSGDSSSDFRSPFYCYATSLNVVFTTDFEMTVAEANTWLANNHLEVCYPLATPIGISLTPQQITSLKSLTTMYADTGNISVDYAADLKTYILNAISQAL